MVTAAAMPPTTATHAIAIPAIAPASKPAFSTARVIVPKVISSVPVKSFTVNTV